MRIYKFKRLLSRNDHLLNYSWSGISLSLCRSIGFGSFLSTTHKASVNVFALTACQAFLVSLNFRDAKFSIISAHIQRAL